MSETKRLDRAVTLASAFVANGDIRIQNSAIREDTTPMAMLEDLIVVIYDRLGSVEERLDFPDED